MDIDAIRERAKMDLAAAIMATKDAEEMGAIIRQLRDDRDDLLAALDAILEEKRLADAK